MHVAYRTESAQTLLKQAGTLAVFSFGDRGTGEPDPRHLQVPLPPLGANPPRECWSVRAEIATGSSGELRWAAGGGWRMTAIEIEEADTHGIRAASQNAYERLIEHVLTSPECHLQRVWNYLGAINAGEGDAERYRLFCSGRARGLAANAVTQYPAATAIGHHGPQGLLQVYALSAVEPGLALENPRQVSAWKYPREYGPTAPSFARAMRLPDGALAISGTAAVIGHASHHREDVTAQAEETFANLRLLLERAHMPAFDAGSPLKVYVRHPQDAPAVQAALARHLGSRVPCVLLRGDICRKELLVEIDGWRFA